MEKLEKRFEGQLPDCPLSCHYFRKSAERAMYIVPVSISFLAIDFLNLNLETLLKVPLEHKPFGKGPWECLSPVCELYKQPRIEKCKVTYTKPNFVGEIACKCGFVYRKYRSIYSEKD